jgi:putative spermidine/putrescine transport system permease protein
VLFLLVPALIVILVSFNPTTRMAVSWEGISLRWYRNLVAQRQFADAFGLSFALAAAATCCSLVLGGSAAYALSRYRVRSARAVQVLFLAPLVVPGTALGVALFLLLNRIRLSETVLGIAVAHVLVTLPYTFRTLLASLDAVDRSIEEAAMSLGATRLTAIRRVTVPLVRPGVIAAALFSVIVSLDEFTITLFVSGRVVSTIPLEIYSATEYELNPTVAAASTVLIGVSALAIVLLEKLVGLNVAYPVRR